MKTKDLELRRPLTTYAVFLFYLVVLIDWFQPENGKMSDENCRKIPSV